MMIHIQNKIVSTDILTEYFCCDYEACKGACCLDGDSGAPILPGEEKKIQEVLPQLQPLLSKAAQEVIAKQGIAYQDESGERVTSLVNKRGECVFVTGMEHGSCHCAIEQWAEDQNSSIRKPISCRLYPIRLVNYPTTIGLFYHRWEICQPARQLGKDRGIKVYQFLQKVLTERFGSEFYCELEIAAKLLEQSQLNNP